MTDGTDHNARLFEVAEKLKALCPGKELVVTLPLLFAEHPLMEVTNSRLHGKLPFGSFCVTPNAFDTIVLLRGRAMALRVLAAAEAEFKRREVEKDANLTETKDREWRKMPYGCIPLHFPWKFEFLDHGEIHKKGFEAPDVGIPGDGYVVLAYVEKPEEPAPDSGEVEKLRDRVRSVEGTRRHWYDKAEERKREIERLNYNAEQAEGHVERLREEIKGRVTQRDDWKGTAEKLQEQIIGYKHAARQAAPFSHVATMMLNVWGEKDTGTFRIVGRDAHSFDTPWVLKWTTGGASAEFVQNGKARKGRMKLRRLDTPAPEKPEEKPDLEAEALKKLCKACDEHRAIVDFKKRQPVIPSLWDSICKARAKRLDELTDRFTNHATFEALVRTGVRHGYAWFKDDADKAGKKELADAYDKHMADTGDERRFMRS